jgi:hypothetical protein
MPFSGKRRKAAFTIMCRQLFCFQYKRKSTLRKQDALDVSVDLFSRAAAEARLRALPAADTASKKSSVAV